MDVINQRGFFILKNKENPDYEFKLKKPSNPRNKMLVGCDCSYFKTMGLPCSHLFAIAQESKDMVDFESTIRERWLETKSFERFEDTKLIHFIDTYFKEKFCKSTFFPPITLAF